MNYELLTNTDVRDQCRIFLLSLSLILGFDITDESREYSLRQCHQSMYDVIYDFFLFIIAEAFVNDS